MFFSIEDRCNNHNDNDNDIDNDNNIDNDNEISLFIVY